MIFEGSCGMRIERLDVRILHSELCEEEEGKLCKPYADARCHFGARRD